MPALHLVRSDIANGELLEALVANSEAKAHALHKNYMEAIAGLRESMADSKTRVDARIDVSEINYKAFHGHVLQSLSTIANNQQAIVEMVHQLRVHSAMQAAAYYQPPDQYARGGLPPPLAPVDPSKTEDHGPAPGQPKGTPFVSQPGTSISNGASTLGRDITRETGMPPLTPLRDGAPTPTCTTLTLGPYCNVKVRTPEPEQCLDQRTRADLTNKGQHSPTTAEIVGDSSEASPQYTQPQEPTLTTHTPAAKLGGNGHNNVETEAKATENGPAENTPMESIANAEPKKPLPPTVIIKKTTEHPGASEAPEDPRPQAREAPLDTPFAHGNRFSFLDIEDVEEPPLSHNSGEPEERLDPWDYPAEYVDLPWSNYHAQRRSKELFNSMTPSGKRKHLLLIKMEEIRESKSILIFGIPHSEIGADYEKNEVQRAWPIFNEISKANMGDRGCDVKPAHIKGGHRLWKWIGDDKCEDKPIKVEFHTKEMALKVLAALKDAGMLGKRTLSKYGLYKPSGKKGQDRKERKKMPLTYVHPSTTKAQRDAIRDQNKYLKSDMYRNRVKSHHFTKHTRLDFSKFVLDSDGILQPKLSDGVEEKLAMMDNPEYKWWYKYFTSNEIPEKIPTKAPLVKKKAAHVNNNSGSDQSLTKEKTDPKMDPANLIVKTKDDPNSGTIANIANTKAKSKAKVKKGPKFKRNPPPATPSGRADPDGTDTEIQKPPLNNTLKDTRQTAFPNGTESTTRTEENTSTGEVLEVLGTGNSLGPHHSPNLDTGPELEPEGTLSGTTLADPSLGVTYKDVRGAAGVLPAGVTDWPVPPNDSERPQVHNELPGGPTTSGGRGIAGGTWTNETGLASAAGPGHTPKDVAITAMVCNRKSTGSDNTTPAAGRTFEQAPVVGSSTHRGEQPLQLVKDTMHPMNQMNWASRSVTDGTDVAGGGTTGSTVEDHVDEPEEPHHAPNLERCGPEAGARMGADGSWGPGSNEAREVG